MAKKIRFKNYRPAGTRLVEYLSKSDKVRLRAAETEKVKAEKAAARRERDEERMYAVFGGHTRGIGTDSGKNTNEGRVPLGATLIPVTKNDQVIEGIPAGCLVTELSPDHLLGRTGIRKGFVLVSMNGRPVTDRAAVEAEIRKGIEITFEIWAAGGLVTGVRIMKAWNGK